MDNLDPLRHIEGFPFGNDDDLHAISKPPFYTAYPNPHIADFIKQYGKAYDEGMDDYHREPFVTDISEGKTDPIYMAHTYHTKVPYKAIVPFIEHYTLPGEIVFDGFCGTGMTGVAAQSMGRKTVLCDLSPIATFIASNNTSSINSIQIESEFRNIEGEVQKECGWMYETKHNDGKAGRINYVIWSDVFICPYCNSEVIFWDQAVDTVNWTVSSEFLCPKCHASLGKGKLSRALEKVVDTGLAKIVERAKQVPTLINYSAKGRRFNKRPDSNDINLINKIENSEVPYWFPTTPVPNGFNTEQPRQSHKVNYVHQFFTKRNLWVIATLWDKVTKCSIEDKRFLYFTITSFLIKTGSRLHNIGFKGGINLAGQVPNTLYIPSIIAERNILELFDGKFQDMMRAFRNYTVGKKEYRIISTQSTTDLSQIPINSIDYIFVDPPFGGNIMYSEVSFIWEAWLKARTNNSEEAIINNIQKKGLPEYFDLMNRSFSEMNRILKPGRWITVEFHNSKASVWNAIQEALARSGFIVAQVTVLDKQQGTFKQMTSAGAVKNDLIINAYKPRAGFTQRLILQAGRGLETDFVREHLRQLSISANAERSKEMLYSKYLAYYVQHGYQVAYNGEQFYRSLDQWGFEERDGYWFADEAQAYEYEQRKIKSFGKKGVQQQAVLFISDERSARLWVWNFLDEPKTYDEIYTAFVKALQTSEDEIPELKIMLEESFVRTNGHWKRPDQLTQGELEQKRLERLLHQFNEYLEVAKAGQKIKEVRREAVLAGFTECYRTGRFQDILTLGNKLDKRLLEESPDLFDFVDIAEAKVEG